MAFKSLLLILTALIGSSLLQTNSYAQTLGFVSKFEIASALEGSGGYSFVDSAESKEKNFIGKFEKAEVTEGSGGYTFIDKNGNEKFFGFDNYYDQKIPYNFFDELANTNEKLKGQWFKITYKNYYQSQFESDEKIWVSKIVTIKKI